MKTTQVATAEDKTPILPGIEKSTPKQQRSYILDPYRDRIIDLYKKGAGIASIARIIRSETNLVFEYKTMIRYIRRLNSTAGATN